MACNNDSNSGGDRSRPNISQTSIISYNLHGFNQGSALLCEFCNTIKPEIIFIQEHWLSSINLDKLHALSRADYHCTASSAMEDVISAGILRGRPFGGLGVLIRNDIASNAKCLAAAERFIVVRIGKLILINVYAPVYSKNYDRNSVTLEMLANINEILSDKSPDDVIVIGGDFNINMTKQCDISDLFLQFVNSNNLAMCNRSESCQINYTFANQAMTQFSCIDYFAISKSITDNFNIAETLDLEPNHSDHLPIRITLDNAIRYLMASDESSAPGLNSKQSDCKDNVKQLRWDHADLFSYYSNIYKKLCPVAEELDRLHSIIHIENEAIVNVHELDRTLCISAIESIYSQIVCILNETADECVPSVPKNFFKFWWDQELDALKQQAISAHREWVQQGRPKTGSGFESKCKQKLQYKNAIRQKRKLNENAFSNDLHEALLEKNQDNFWKMWKSKFAKKSNIPASVDGSVSHEEIANKFASFFADTCISNNSEKSEKYKENYMDTINGLKCNLSVNNCLFSVDSVENAICELKRGKAAGRDGLTAEYLHASHPILISILVQLFDLMLIFQYVPDAFGLGLSVPLPKSLSGHSDCLDDYRCITVSPVLSKVFEKCLLEKLQKYLDTSHLQVGFKKKLSCSHAIFTLSTTIEHFVTNLSTVNICTIDLSKAFDRVNHYCLFTKLIKRGVPLNFVNLLQCWYSKVFIYVRWVNTLSRAVSLLTGVRQGGILSPILFLVYVDDLLLALEKSKLGCVIKGFFVGALMYADDIVLLCPSVTILQLMLGLCGFELAEIDMSVNVKKTMCLRIGRRFDEFCKELAICGKTLKWVNQIRYLGIFFNSGKTLKTDQTVVKRKFFVSCNCIFSKIVHYKADLILPLVSSYCIPILMYGLEAVRLNKTDVTRLSHPYTMVFHKIFGTYSNAIISQCHYFTGCLPLDYLYKLRQLCFLNNIKEFSKDNILCTHLYKNFGYKLFTAVASEFNIIESDNKPSMKFKIWSKFSNIVEH